MMLMRFFFGTSNYEGPRVSYATPEEAAAGLDFFDLADTRRQQREIDEQTAEFWRSQPAMPAWDWQK